MNNETATELASAIRELRDIVGQVATGHDHEWVILSVKPPDPVNQPPRLLAISAPPTSVLLGCTVCRILDVRALPGTWTEVEITSIMGFRKAGTDAS